MERQEKLSNIQTPYFASKMGGTCPSHTASSFITFRWKTDFVIWRDQKRIFLRRIKNIFFQNLYTFLNDRFLTKLSYCYLYITRTKLNDQNIFFGNVPKTGTGDQTAFWRFKLYILLRVCP